MSRIKQMNYKFVPILIKKIHKDAIIPKPAHDGDIGYDLYPLEEIELQPGKTTICPTGLQVVEDIQLISTKDNTPLAVPFMKIEGRSGLASKGVFPVGGIIDSSYRGEIGVILFNSTNEVVKLTPRKAMAQLVIYCTLANCQPHMRVQFLESDNEQKTDRGSNGFGSSDQS